MKKKSSEITIIMPNYNHGCFLEQAIQSISSQTAAPADFILLDDGSTDNSIAVIENSANQYYPNLKLLRHEQNKGTSAAVENLLAEVQTPYFLPLAADDYLLPEFLETSQNMLTLYPEAALCSTMCLSISISGDELGIWPSPVPCWSSQYFSPAVVKQLLMTFGGWFLGNTTVFHLERFTEEDGFSACLDTLADGFISHVLALRFGACFIPRPLVAWRSIPTSASTVALKDSKRNKNIEANLRLKTSLPKYQELFPEGYISDWILRRQFWLRVAKAKELSLTSETIKSDEPFERRTNSQDRRVGMLLCKIIQQIIKLKLLLAGIVITWTWPASLNMYRWVILNLLFKLKRFFQIFL